MDRKAIARESSGRMISKIEDRHLALYVGRFYAYVALIRGDLVVKVNKSRQRHSTSADLRLGRGAQILF